MAASPNPLLSEEMVLLAVVGLVCHEHLPYVSCLNKGMIVLLKEKSVAVELITNSLTVGGEYLQVRVIVLGVPLFIPNEALGQNLQTKATL
ncbi:hypothetical protein FQA47_010410 [Oryzias melastigma]|uniref:Uncharacterized protein n=1 Tax=Oryzias melastigma TaxID=30732 RepID=A0A834F8M4_ORYME|nr:hypothetical protein FQA47_010410 [Oryzias melastigma]